MSELFALMEKALLLGDTGGPLYVLGHMNDDELKDSALGPLLATMRKLVSPELVERYCTVIDEMSDLEDALEQISGLDALYAAVEATLDDFDNAINATVNVAD